ncbi:MAG TPA: RagB/SusD family nutrient uptake outer membrane protein [Puia sp.]|nr:RagB/SusD family nutrient uptake outer membrane protein [Puia sp.]
MSATYIIRYKFLLLHSAVLMLLFSSCKKFTEIDPPKNRIVTTQVFSDDNSANAAISGIYYQLNSTSMAQGYMTVNAGLSADELNALSTSTDAQQLQNNVIQVNNGNVLSLWTGAYNVIAQANACLDGLNASVSLSAAKKSQFTGESKFLRAFCHFYLTNLFGDVPLVLTTDFNQTDTMQRTSQAKVYQQILQDLQDAQNALPESNPAGVVRVSKWAAAALLARANLYGQNWATAETLAGSVINAFGNQPLPDPNSVFLIGSAEAIWQLQPPSYASNPFEPNTIFSYGTLYYSVTDGLLNSFETGDLRRTAWLDSTYYNGALYYYPYKYKSSTYQSPSTEYYMILRLAEQYLIRAEAAAHQNKVSVAVQDINVIRTRAGLGGLSSGISQTDCLLAIEQERRVELFAEWGHRWLDLKRTGNAAAVLSPIKPAWISTGVLYPVPVSEIKLNPHLSQNVGY